MRVLAVIIICLLLTLINVGSILVDTKYRIEPVRFRSDSYLLNGCIYIPEEENRKVIILSHGFNRLGARHYLYKEMAERFAKLGYTVMSFDYRGFGYSESPEVVDEAKDLDFSADAKAAFYLVKERFKSYKEFIIVGHSFGAGVAMKVGIEEPFLNKIVCISPGRRAMSLYFNDKPLLGVAWLQERIKEEMKIKQLIEPDLIRQIFIPITIDTFKDVRINKPILFIDGGEEPYEDLVFLREYVAYLNDPLKSYLTIPGAHHYFGVLAYTKIYDSTIIQQLIDSINNWINEKN